jgi:tetratricopeptide (TPR) repeat protein
MSRGPTPGARIPAILALTALALLLFTPGVGLAQSPLEAARADLFAGRYEAAEDALRPLVRQGDLGARLLMARTLGEQGEYEDALDVLPAGEIAAARARGEILMVLGRQDEARAAFQASLAGGAPDAEVARLRLAEQSFHAGDRDEAMAVFDGFIDLYNGGRQLSGDELLAVARAVTYLGRRNPALFQDALRAYDQAAERLPEGDPRPRVAVGDLFLSKYLPSDAYEEYGAVLARNAAQPEALLGRARAQDFDNAPEALATAQAALETNENLVGAHLLIARIRLRAENLDEARESVSRALEVNPRHLEALSLQATVEYLAGETATYRRTVARLDELNPVDPGLYTTLAEVSADQRQYARAVDFASQAVARDERAWDARGLLATNQLRTGAMAEGRANMEAAFAGDPFNPWFKNTLDLLDTFERFREIRTEHFQILVREDEADLLEPYVTELAEAAWADLRDRYGATPPTPIRVELLPSSADFSVRTLGMPGLGALGVSFGSTLVMDSPSARQAGEFNWASTLWHEMAHAYHLGLSDHEVPRWFSEGLAVREQRVADERWGFRADPGFLQAWRSGAMPPLSRMNEGFVRPSFPGQVAYSYLQASLAFDWIEGEYGFQAIRSFLDGYRVGRTTEELAESILGLDADALDEAFEEYMETRFATELASTAELPGPGAAGETPGGLALPGAAGGDVASLRARARSQPGSFSAQLALGRALMAEGRLDEAEEPLGAAQRLFPGYAGGLEGPLAGLARIHESRGELAEAADALRRLGELDENAYAVYQEEARLRRELGDAPGERVALSRAVEVYPYEPDTHLRLAELAEAAGDTGTAVRERRALLALDPVDRADAHYRLALALVADGQPEEARSQVLRCLEIAPSFGPALELLLELRGGPS